MNFLAAALVASGRHGPQLLRIHRVVVVRETERHDVVQRMEDVVSYLPPAGQRPDLPIA
jgi:hypothetical protein